MASLNFPDDNPPASRGLGDVKNPTPIAGPNVELDPMAGPNGGQDGRRLASFWLKQIQEVDDDGHFKRWLKRGTTIEKRYRDERNRVDEEGQRRVNTLWANVEILRPALYGKVPVPTCERKFRDRDPVGRGAAEILERALQNEIEINGFDEAMRQALTDYLLPGRGSVWVRYEPEFGEGISIPVDDDMDKSDSQGDIESDDESPEESKLKETGIRVIRESTPVDYVQWTDFYTFPSKARIWKEVVAVGKRVYMTRDQMKRRFGSVIGRTIPFQPNDRRIRRQEDTSSGHDVEEKAQIYEIWDKAHQEVVWVAEGYPYLCDRKDDPLRLDGFFPCPKPLYANPTNNTLIPVPDYMQYQDQAILIDELTQRISMLAKACKVAGVYNSAAKGIQRLFNESVENEMIPVDDWAAFAEKGGIAGNLSFIPLKEIMGVIEELTKIKERAVVEMDRLTGINDIMRGTTDARETLGGQRLKSNASGTRLQARQNEVARFARDVLRIMADIMCQHFSAQSLVEVSGAIYEQGLGTMDNGPNDQLANQPPTAGGPPNGPPGAPQMPGQPPRPGLPPPGGMPPGGLPHPGMPAGPMPAMPPHPPMQGVPNMPPGMPPHPGIPPQILPPQKPPIPGQPVPPVMPSFGFQGRMPPNPEAPPGLDPQQQEVVKGFERIVKAIQLIRNDRLRGFRVDIEVESTIYADTQQEKGDRTAFIASVTQFLQQSMMISSQMPQAAPLLGKFLQFGVRGFNVGRELEQAIEDFCDEAVVAAKMHQQQQQSQPNPLLIKAQADAAKSQADTLKAHADIQSQQQKMQIDAQQAQAEVQRQQLENEGQAQSSQSDQQQKQMDFEMRQLEAQIEMMRLQLEKIKLEGQLKLEQQKSVTAQHQSLADQQQASLNLQNAHMQNQQNQQKMAQQQQQHEQNLQMQREQQQHEREQNQLGHQRSLEDAERQRQLAEQKFNQQMNPFPTRYPQ